MAVFNLVFEDYWLKNQSFLLARTNFLKISRSFHLKTFLKHILGNIVSQDFFGSNVAKKINDSLMQIQSDGWTMGL